MKRKIASLLVFLTVVTGTTTLSESAQAASTCSGAVSLLKAQLNSTSASKGTLVANAWSNYASCLQSAGISSSKITSGDCGYLKQLIVNHYKLEQSYGLLSANKSEKALFEFELCATGAKSSVLASNYLGGCSTFQTLVGNWNGYGDMSLANYARLASTGCVARYQIAIASAPTISGSGTEGTMLSSSPGTWSPGVEFAYQWRRNGEAVYGATSRNYVVTQADVGQKISLRLTGSRWGYAGSARSGTSGEIIAKAPLPAQIKVPAIKLSGGIYKVGKTWTCSPGIWDSGVKVNYQWFRDEVLIAGATAASYRFTADDVDAFIRVTITGVKTGYKDQAFQATTPSKIALGTQTKVPTIEIYGLNRVASQFKIDPGKWDPGVSLSYRWFLNDLEIVDWNFKTYTPNPADLGKILSFEVTGTKAGYEDRTYSFDLSNPIALGVQSKKPTPKLSKATKVGQTIQLSAGTWDAGSSQQIIWYRDSTPIPENEGQLSYTLSSIDRGHRISAKVISTKDAFVPISKKTAASAKIS